MPKLFEVAHRTSRCEHCGGRVEIDGAYGPAAMLTRRWCKPRCREAADAAAAGRACIACGHPCDRRRQYGLDLCLKCTWTVVKGCWRKRRYPNQDTAPTTGEHNETVHPYDCLMCPHWHVSHLTQVPDEFLARATAIGEALTRLGFDIDTARGWSVQLEPAA